MDPIEVVKSRYDAIKANDEALFFVIAKSSNKNTLAYSYDATTILNPYWLMYEKTKNGVTPTETITFLENQLAYGFTAKQIDSTSYQITLAGYKKIFFQFRRKQDDCEGDTSTRELTINLDGDYFQIMGIYVHQSVGFFTSGIDGISIVFFDKDGSLKAKYLANHET